MCQGPGAVNEHHVGCQQHYEYSVGQSDQPTIPLGAAAPEGLAEQQVEAQPANQAVEHLTHHQHASLQGTRKNCRSMSSHSRNIIQSHGNGHLNLSVAAKEVVLPNGCTSLLLVLSIFEILTMVLSLVKVKLYISDLNERDMEL